MSIACSLAAARSGEAGEAGVATILSCGARVAAHPTSVARLAANAAAPIALEPPGVVAEILGGVLHTQPRPALKHAGATTVLGEELGPPFRRGRGGPGGWIFLDEPELHLEADVVVPDLAGWRRERLPDIPDAAFLTLASDWACETLSPRTAATDRADKLPIYARERVSFVWFVDPIAQTLEVFRLDGDTYRAVRTWRGDACVRAEPFDAIELDLALLWHA